jgi:hypothetical protein
VFDRWRHVRSADDFVVGFQYRDDAERFRDDLRARLAEFALELHPEKTRLLEFGRFASVNRGERGLGKPETFDFLGLTRICGRTRAGGFMPAAAHGDLGVPHDPEATHARQIQELALDLRLTLAEYRRVVLDIDEEPQEDPFAD